MVEHRKGEHEVVFGLFCLGAGLANHFNEFVKIELALPVGERCEGAAGLRLKLRQKLRLWRPFRRLLVAIQLIGRTQKFLATVLLFNGARDRNLRSAASAHRARRSIELRSCAI